MTAEKTINFMAARKIALLFSALLLCGSLFSLSTQGLRLGLDFTGGTLIEVGYDRAANLEVLRSTLLKNDYRDAQVINFGSDSEVLIRLPQANSSGLGDAVLAALQQQYSGNIQLKRIEYVGPQVGEELREQGGMGLLIALLCVMVYVAFRFQFKFSLGAVLALGHDVLITLGVFSVFQLDFDLTVLAALLAVIGYSLNDTIVVSDRIRENFRLMRKGSAETIINRSLTQTLGRTLMTSITTLLVLSSLFIFGGEIIHGFATALIVGVLVGTYSSIFVAANVLLALGICKEDLIVPQVEGTESIDSMP